MLFSRQHAVVDHTEESWSWAEEFANDLFQDSKKNNRKNNHGIPESENTDDENYRKGFQGAIAECTVHLYTGEKWHRKAGSVGKKSKLADIGDDIQVRSRRFGFPLIHRPSDDPNQKYVLVWVNIDEKLTTIVGWLYGWECRAKGDKTDPQNRKAPIWEVSPLRLRPIDTIKD